MSTFETPSPALLQGVSQQRAEERLPGQLTAQVNMLSDPTTGIRRRPGMSHAASWTWSGALADNVLAWHTDIAGEQVHVLLNTGTGNVRVLNSELVQEASLTSTYLQAASTSSIRATTVGNEFFIANVEKVPALAYAESRPNPQKHGFFYVAAGAFDKQFTIYATSSGAPAVIALFTTPDGTTAGDAALASPANIAAELAAQLSSGTGISVYQDGPYVFLVPPPEYDWTITSLLPDAYIVTSKAANVSSVGLLPSRLPPEADGFVCRVGSRDASQYYRYNHATLEWLEDSAWGSPTGITNVPISLTWNGTVWALDSSAFSGRAAGDDENNKAHEFMQNGITGVSTFQGRLVLMSGPLVSASRVNAPRQFWRSTVTSLVASDAFEIGSGMNSSAAYEWAVPFQKDLLVFSKKYQAVLPSANNAVTPATATVVPTSAHEVDTTSSPIALGRTLMYCTPRSRDFFGVMEIVPSPYTDAQYVSQDATPHLPKYMPGRCRFAVASGVASIALFAPEGDQRSLIVHEYHWDGDTKVQQAWHTWTFGYDVAWAYFSGDEIIVVMVNNGVCVLGSIDPRAGSTTTAGERKPYLDLHNVVTVTANLITVPAWMLQFDPDCRTKMRAIASTGAMAGEPIHVEPEGTTQMRTARAYASGALGIGIPYYSGCIPASPVIRDYEKRPVVSGKATLLRYMVGVANTSAFTATVSDSRGGEEESAVPALAFDSSELSLDRGLFSDAEVHVIPCRTDLRSTVLELSTSGTGELNIVSLDYVGRHLPRFKRR